jgi:Protein of unknown function (DUF3226)
MGLGAFTKPRFMLCEGDDDKAFFDSLIATRRLPEFQVCTSFECGGIGGKTGFSASLKGMEVLSGWRNLKALLIVADNDVVDASFAETQDALAANNHTPPPDPTGIGNMLGKPVTILMIPDARTAGDLEKLCLPAIYAKWPQAPACVEAFLRCTGATAWTKQSSINKARARSAAVGFYEPDPYKGIGILFAKGVVSVYDACFDPLVQYFQNFDAMCGI